MQFEPNHKLAQIQKVGYVKKCCALVRLPNAKRPLEKTFLNYPGEIVNDFCEKVVPN